MKIAHVIGNMDASSGGAQKIVDHICHFRASEREYQHVVFAALQKGSGGFDDVVNVGLRPFEVPLRLASQLAEFCRDENVDLVHIHSAVVGPWARRAADKLHLPAITSIHGYPSRYKSPVWFFERRSIGSDRKIVCVSSAVKHELLRYLPFLKNKVSVIHNGIDLEKFCQLSRSRNSCLDGLTGAGAPYSILVVGRLHRQKGVDVAIHAISTLRDRGVAIMLDVVGDGGERARLEKLAVTLGVRDYIRFHGATHDVRPFLEACSMALLPSKGESFGLTFLEALVAGVPLIATRLQAFEEIYPEFPHFVPVNDSDAIAREIQKMLGSLDVENQEAQDSARNWGRRFSVRAMVDAYDDIYSRILNTDEQWTEKSCSMS